VALAVAVAAASLLTLWATTIPTGLPDAEVVILQVVGLALVLSLHAVWRARQIRQQRKTARAARERVLADCGGALFAVIASAVAILPWIAIQPMAGAALGGVALAGLSGILLSTAVASGLEAVLPRRATVEELYSHRPHKR
jgi:Na+/H+ antiporter NhaD/arsenite permease-like protein